MSNADSFDSNLDANPFDEVGQEGSDIGKTSREKKGAPRKDNDASETKTLFQKLFSDINLFDSFLMVSFLLVTFATFYLFLSTSEYGGYFWNFPWRVQL